MIDPWTPVINRLWAILNADSDFLSRVRTKNQIVFIGQNAENSILKQASLQPGDSPEVEIAPGACPQDWAPSTLTMDLDQTFVITIKSGDLRLWFNDGNGTPQGINVLAWIVTRALYAAGDNLTLSGNALGASLSRVVVGAPLLLTSEQNRGKAGWTQLITLHVRQSLNRFQNTISYGDTDAPVITSLDYAVGLKDFPFIYQITATNFPTSFGATGLPDGVTINTATGLISGTPTGQGTFTTIVSATNDAGTGTESVTITIGGTSGGMPPIIQDATPDPDAYEYGQLWYTLDTNPILVYELTPNDGGGGKIWRMVAQTGMNLP